MAKLCDNRLMRGPGQPPLAEDESTMSSFRFLPISLVLAACGGASTPSRDGAVAVSIVVSASERQVDSDEPPSRVYYRSTTTSTWSNPARNGAIDTPVPQLGELQAIADSSELGVPRFVVLSPDAQHLVVLSDESISGWHVESGRRFLWLGGTAGRLVQTWATGLTHNGEEWDWEGKVTGAQLGTGSGFLQLNQLIGLRHVMGITAHPDIRDRPYPVTVVTWAEYAGSGDELSATTALVRELAGSGSGAFGDDARAAIALSDGRLVVVVPRREREGYPQAAIAVDQNLDFEPREISIIEPNYYLVGDATRDEPPPDAVGKVHTVATTPEQETTPNEPMWARERPDSTLRVVGPDGQELWQVSVPFEVRQPAVRGPRGLVYLVGRGVAAVERGNVRWQLSDLADYTAASDEDGRLLVSAGRRLLLISPQGELIQTVTVPVGEHISTPAAISSTGWVFLATEKAVYRTRIEDPQDAPFGRRM